MMKHFLSIIIIILITLLSSISSNSTQIYFAPEKSDDTQSPSQVDYIRDWTVQIPNQSNGGKSNGPVYYSQESNDDAEMSPLDGPMDSTWPMQSHDVKHTGWSQYSTENNSGAELWRVKGDWAGVVWSSAVIDINNTIYYGTLGKQLFALHPNGTRKWRYHATGLIWCTPALAEDGTLYFTTDGGYGYV
ncbi:MAG: hypothetical protein BV458_10030, partial [Thermoplasmata archaeon M9B2D]